MAFSARLGKNGTPAEKLDVKCVVVFAKGDAGWKIARSELTVRGTVPGIDNEKFVALAEDAKENCPVSAALKGNVELVVDAALA
jgi:osmotically inducible protein OsmC